MEFEKIWYYCAVCWYSISLICLNLFTLLEIMSAQTPYFAATTYATAISVITVAFSSAFYLKRDKSLEVTMQNNIAENINHSLDEAVKNVRNN
jgi:hypothetical protein